MENKEVQTNAEIVEINTTAENKDSNGDGIQPSSEKHESQGHHEHHASSHSHHSHHHHHHRRSSRRSKKTHNKQREKVVNFFKDNKKYLIHAALIIAVATCLVLIGVFLDQRLTYTHGDTDEGKQGNTDVLAPSGELKITVPFFENDVTVIGAAVDALMQAEPGVLGSDIYKKYISVSDRLDVGLPVELSYRLDNVPKGYVVKKVEFLVSENSNFENPMLQVFNDSRTEADFFHLKTGTQYYYRINLTFSNGTETTVGGNFKTAEGPRVLTVGGVYNLRDIGGWTTTGGQRVKQGLLYRGCEIDGAVEPHYQITSDGLNDMLSVFGIKTDMDLRAPSDNQYGTNALGASVNHVYYSAPMYTAIFGSEANTEAIRRIFSDLAHESNYPIYMHCTYGTDRTGTVVYLLGALLGVGKDSLMKDYELSALHHGEISSSQIQLLAERIEELPGQTTREKVEHWLLSIGVTEREISGIRKIFLEQ